MEISSRLKSLLVPSTRVTVLTGAGVSQESGVPTFRDKDGLWQKFRPEELANMQAFLNNPGLVWEWYEHRRKVIREVRPNRGHEVLSRMQDFFGSFHLITQNVDGLHARAGSRDILEVHGNIMRSFCVDCGRFAPPEFLENLKAGDRATCLECEGLLRPDVVWFGEMLPTEVWEKSQQAAAHCDLFLSIGTSAAVYPAAGLPLYAKECGAYVVEINPQETEISHLVDEVLSGPSAVVLPELEICFSR
jgi:NAD-dependent deacetylase